MANIDKRGRSTPFFTQLVQEKSRNQGYTSVGRELGISASTVMKKQDLLTLDKFYLPKAEELYLGVDGKYLNSDEEIFVIGEVKLKEFMGVTISNSSVDLERILQEKIADQGKVVEAIAMDMSKLIKRVCQKIFPEAAIVTDKFHAIKHVKALLYLSHYSKKRS